SAGHDAGREGSTPGTGGERGRSSMDLKRYFRGPFLAVLVTLVVVIAVFEYASAGGGYKSVDTSQVVSLINRGDVKTATLVDKNNTIQITTKQGDKLQASWVGNQGQVLQQELQHQYQNKQLSSY